MQGDCEPSGPSPCELGLRLPPPIDTGDICEAFSSLKLRERNEGGAVEVEMVSEGVERGDRGREDEGGGGSEKAEERVESGDGERKGNAMREEGRDGERENVGREKREEMMDGDSDDNVKTESNGDSEKKREEEEQRRDSDSEEGEIGVEKQRIGCGSEHEEVVEEAEVGCGDNEEEIGEKEHDRDGYREEHEGEEKEEEMDCTKERKEEEEKAPKVKFPISYPQRPFTPDCLTYLKSGYCSFGMACCFNHPLKKSSKVPLNGDCKEKERDGDQEKKVLVGGGEVMNAQYYPQREGKEDCAFYMKTGRCDYGLKCCFNHPPRNSNQVTENREYQTALDDRNGPRESYMNWAVGPSTSHIRRRPDCARYVKEGCCDYGAECRFFHHRSRRPYEFNWNPGRDWQEKCELETNFLGLPLRPVC